MMSFWDIIRSKIIHLEKVLSVKNFIKFCISNSYVYVCKLDNFLKIASLTFFLLINISSFNSDYNKFPKGACSQIIEKNKQKPHDDNFFKLAIPHKELLLNFNSLSSSIFYYLERLNLAIPVKN